MPSLCLCQMLPAELPKGAPTASSCLCSECLQSCREGRHEHGEKHQSCFLSGLQSRWPECASQAVTLSWAPVASVALVPYGLGHQNPATMKAVSAIPVWKDSKMWLLEEEGEDTTFEFINRIKKSRQWLQLHQETGWPLGLKLMASS